MFFLLFWPLVPEKKSKALAQATNDSIVSEILKYNLEMGPTKSFRELEEHPDDDAEILRFRMELEEKLKQLHLPLRKELDILQQFNLSTIEGLQELDKKIKKVAMKVWERDQKGHLARQKELQKEKEKRMEIVAMQAEKKEEEIKRKEEKEKKQKEKERQNQVLDSFWKVSKRRVCREVDQLLREENQKRKAFLFMKNVQKKYVPMSRDGKTPNFDWKSVYSEYLEYSRKQKKNETEKIKEIDEEYKGRLEELKNKSLSQSSYIKQAFREDNHEKWQKEFEKKKPRAESSKAVDHPPIPFEKSAFYRNIEREMSLSAKFTPKKANEEKRMKIAQYMAKIRENQMPDISKKLREEQQKRIEEIHKKESIHEMIEERLRKAKENQKNYLAELKKETEARGPIKKKKGFGPLGEHENIFKSEKPEGPFGNSRFPNYLGQMRSSPNLVYVVFPFEIQSQKETDQPGPV